MHKPHHKYLEATITKTNPYLEYLSKFPQLSTTPLTLSQLDDGLILLDLLRMITDMQIQGQIQEHPRNFFHRFSNLKVLFQSIEIFWQRVLGYSIEGQEIDLVLIAHTSNVYQIEKLLQLFIKTAAQAQNKWIFIEKILQTSQHTQQYLKKIIETVIGNESKQSPRKQKQKRMYDKILELDHQNDKLQQIVEEVCDQKLQLQNKIKTLESKLEDKYREIDRLQNIVDQDLYTPQKKKITGIPDTIDRKDNQIESLKLQIIEISSIHQKELQQCFNQLEKMVEKINQMQSIKQELQQCRQTLQSNKQAMTDSHKTLNTLKAELMTKDNIIVVLKQRMQKCEQRLVDMEKAQMHYKSELQRRNVQLSELTSKLQYQQHRLSPDKPNYNHNTLYLQFPAIANSEADVYIETNRNLREELERTRRQLEDSQVELTQNRHSLDLLKNSQQENRKLRQIIINLQSYRGQQIDILVGSLHYLRKMLPLTNQDKNTLKEWNGISRNLFSK